MNFQKSKSKNLFGRVKSEESQNWPKSVLKFFFRDSKSHFVEVPGLLVSFWPSARGGGD